MLGENEDLVIKVVQNEEERLKAFVVRSIVYIHEQNCPYDVIQMAPEGPEPRKSNLLMDLLLGRKPQELPSEASAQKAVKCDMCKGLPGGAACVRACPTGAAIRVSPAQFADYM